jgi:hypothetical protein
MKNFEKNIFAQGQTLYTQDEFNSALAEAKAEIMAIAIQTTKQAIQIERNACADLALQWSQEELSEAIRHRMRMTND